MFTALVGIVALIVAGCAAFFSVQGLATLYAARYIAVCVMAGGLEIGKLVAASFLHRYWKSISWLLKLYLIIAVIILMGITSLGIFGFLTGAYQQSHVKVELTDTKQEALNSKKEFLNVEINQLNDRIKTLNEARKSQESRLPTLSKRAAAPIYEDIKRSSEEISNARKQIDDLSSQLFRTSEESINQKIEGSKEVDIGTLKYVAKAFGVDMDTIVKWFTLAIVFVFDPLAVALVLAYNTLIEKKELIKAEKPKKSALVNSPEFEEIEKEYIKVENSENSPLVYSNSETISEGHTIDGGRIIKYRDKN
jgi:transcriptional regulator with XRE-family HTH domain